MSYLLLATTEDYCGVEPITHPPNIVETRPPFILDEEKLRQAYNQTDSAILGSKLLNLYQIKNIYNLIIFYYNFILGVLAILFLALVILAVLIGRYLHRHKGEYLTQEDLGADNADDPDTAVVLGTTGHHVEKKKEYYI